MLFHTKVFVHNNFNQRWNQSSPLTDRLCFYSTRKCFPASSVTHAAGSAPPISIVSSFKRPTINSELATKRFKSNDIRLSTCFHRSHYSSTSSSSLSNSTSTNQTTVRTPISNRSSFQSSKSIFQQNRILINYKKLTQFENFFLKNLSFLKKNFEIIHSYLKASTKSSDLNLVPEVKELSESSFDGGESSQISHVHKEVQLRHKPDTERRAFSEPLNFCINSNKCSSFCLNPVDKNKLLFRFSNSFNRSNIADRNFTKDLHLKLFLNLLCKRNSSFFNELEAITIRLENPLLNKKSKELAEFSRIELSKDALSYISENCGLQPQMEFSMSMIKFTLYLRKLLSHIDQVKLII